MDKSILRLGTYELLYTDLDRAVIIDEAVELAKELGGDQSPKFVNGVLDAIEKSHKKTADKAETEKEGGE